MKRRHASRIPILNISTVHVFSADAGGGSPRKIGEVGSDSDVVEELESSATLLVGNVFLY